jgi:hypothetical protein
MRKTTPTDYSILYKKLCNLAAHRLANSIEFQIAEAKAEINLLNRQLHKILSNAIKHPEIIECTVYRAEYLASFDPKYKQNQADVKKWQDVISILKSKFPYKLSPEQLVAGTIEVYRILSSGKIDIESLSRQEQFHLVSFIPDAPNEWNYLDDSYNTTIEPTIGTILIEGREIGIVTRNSYGVNCLNSYGAMFVDIDLDSESEDVSYSSLPWGNNSAPEYGVIKTAITEVANDYDLVFQVFKTARGLRLLELTRTWDALGIESQTILERLGSDRLYQQLCIKQQCYRARMEPKPWRDGITVCRDLERIGNGSISPENEVILKFHALCVGDDELG